MKYEIEIEGLPGGMIAHSVKVIELDSGDSEQCTYNALVIAKRVKPRRIVLEETAMVRYPRKGDYYFYRGCLRRWSKDNECDHEHTIWREVKETDPSLNNADGLRLSVEECKTILTNSSELRTKINKFIKDK